MSELPGDLERALGKLDARAAGRAARVDPERVAARVLERLRSERAPSRWLAFPLRLAIPAVPRWAEVAAAAALVVVAGGIAAGVLRGGGGSLAVPVVAQSLDSLSRQQLETVLSVAAEVRPVVSDTVRLTGGVWEELSEEQLRAVLQAVQQVEVGGGTL